MEESPTFKKMPRPLQRNPVSPLPSSPLSPPAQTFILGHPSARLSSSPASSPRVVEPPPTRTRSIHPEMSNLMAQGMTPGADFFFDSSGEDSEWEDDNGTRNFSGAEGLGIRGSGSAGRGTPRNSILSNADSDILPKPLNVSRNQDDADAIRKSSFQSHYRRNTSESLRADSILNAHFRTMQALESMLPSSPPASQPSFSQRKKEQSFSEQRHIKLLPIQTRDADPNRPPHLPAHFIKTPYPFTAKKEFPKPKTRPRRREADGKPFHHDNHKGKQVLGIATSEGDFKLKSRLERDQDTQDMARSHSDSTRSTRQWGSVRSTDGVQESVVWLSLRRNRHPTGIANRLEQIIIPSSLVTTTTTTISPPHPLSHKPKPSRFPKRTTPTDETPIDFDDMFFAQSLRRAYATLAGPWILRALSARKLKYIQLAQLSAWSASHNNMPPSTSYRHPLPSPPTALLAARHGLPTPLAPSTPFTEHNLLALYTSPRGTHGCTGRGALPRLIMRWGRIRRRA